MQDEQLINMHKLLRAAVDKLNKVIDCFEGTPTLDEAERELNDLNQSFAALSARTRKQEIEVFGGIAYSALLENGVYKSHALYIRNQIVSQWLLMIKNPRKINLAVSLIRTTKIIETYIHSAPKQLTKEYWEQGYRSHAASTLIPTDSTKLIYSSILPKILFISIWCSIIYFEERF
jgi:hypothetical protein